MNKNGEKTKLLAAVAAMLMIICAVAVIAMPSETEATPVTPADADAPFGTVTNLDYKDGVYTPSQDVTVDLGAEGVNLGTAENPLDIRFDLSKAGITFTNSTNKAVTLYINYSAENVTDAENFAKSVFRGDKSDTDADLTIGKNVVLDVTLSLDSGYTTETNKNNHVLTYVDVVLNDNAKLVISQATGVGGVSVYGGSIDANKGTTVELDGASGVNTKLVMDGAALNIVNPKTSTAFINLEADSSIASSTITSTSTTDNGMDLYIDEATTITGTTINMGAADVVIVAGNTVTMDSESSVTAKQIKYRVVDNASGTAGINGGSVSGEFVAYDANTTGASFTLDGTSVSGATSTKDVSITVGANGVALSGNVDFSKSTMTATGKIAVVSGTAKLGTGVTNENVYVAGGSATINGTAVPAPGADATVSVSNAEQFILFAGQPNMKISIDANITLTSQDVVIASGTTVTGNSLVMFDADSTIQKVGAGNVYMKVQSTSDSSFVELNLNGAFTVKDGSVFVDDCQLTGTNTITLRDNSTVRISGSLNGNLSIVTGSGFSGADVIFEDFTINSNGKLTLAYNENITYSVESRDTANGGYFYLYGTIVPAGTDDVTIEVASKNTFRAYAGAQLSSDVLVQPAEGATEAVIDLSQAQSTLTVSQDVVASVSYGQLQSIVIDGVLSIRNNSTLTIQGDLLISEGTILTIENGSKLVVEGIVATVTVDGTIEIVDGGSFVVNEAEDVSISGTVNSYGTVSIGSDGKEVSVTIDEGGVVRINEGDESKIAVTGGLTVAAGGELLVSSDMNVTEIANNGTVTLSGAVLTSDSEISLTATGAVVNIVSVTAGTAQHTLTVNDEGLKFADDGRIVGGEKITHVVGTDDDNSIVITLNANTGISGLTVTETVSGNGSEKTPYVNEMYFAGTVAYIDNNDYDADDPAVTFGGMTVDGDRLYISEALTLGAGITMSVDGNMDVDGTVTAVADGSEFNIGAGEVTVNGLIQLVDRNKFDSNEVLQLNAAYYSVTGSGTTPTYHYYTNFADAVAANPATVYIYGEVPVDASITIPATMTIRNEGTLVIGSTDDRDVTVTVSNGAVFRSGTVEVFGTLYFENKRNDSITTPISDVRIEGDADRTYTNIYTALNDAEAGETVTITRDGIVWLDADLTIKTGVILDVPNTRYIGLENGVTLTVDGTLRTAHPVELREGGDFDVEASNTNDKKASAIVVNGTFMSMADMPYADDEVAGQQGYMIPGAYYTMIDSNGVYNYITPVEAAAAVSANAVEGAFTINGKVTSGDVTFTATDVQPVTVTVSDGSEYTAASITLVGATLETVDDGLFNGTVTVGDASIEAYKVQLSVDSENGLTLQAMVDERDEKDASKVISTLNVTAGTVNVDMIYGDITVDAGATMTVPNVTDNRDGVVYGDVTIDGTLSIANRQALTVTGDLFVNGIVTVAAASDAGAAGTLYVGTNTNSVREGTMYVGLDEKFATTGATATVTGIVNVPTIYAVAGATVDAEIIEDMDTTAYYVEGAVWINAYGDGDLVMPNMKNAPVENAYFNNVWQNEAGTVKYDCKAPVAGEEDTVKNSTIGTPEAVYAIVEYDVYVINLRADQNAVSSITIDGNVMQFGMIMDTTTGSEGFYYGYTAIVSAGSHTIQYQLANGYSGEGVLTVNGTQQSGLTFTTEGNPTEAQGGKITYNLQLTGFEKSGYVPDSPDTGDSGDSDSAMTITDYLLIVLVVLIIVMAIIVAMRLMRS